MNKDKIISAISFLDPDLCYHDWLRVGMAIHDGTEGSDEGLRIWDEWSRQGDKYEHGVCEKKWRSFWGGSITVATLYHMAKAEGWEYQEQEEDMKPNEIDPGDLPCLAIPERKITELVTKVYDVHSSVLEEDGKTLHYSYFPVKRNDRIIGWRIKDRVTTNKKEKYPPDIGNTKGKKEFFGQTVAKQCRGKKLIICEGQDDVLAMTECLIKHTKKEYSAVKPGVVGVHDGAGSLVNCCTENREFIEKFEEIILAFDPDEEGRKAVERCLKTFPKFKVAELPEGLDVNDMWIAGRGEELYNIVVWRSKNKRLGQVVTIDESFIDKALEKPTFGLSTPWPSVDRKIFGIKPHTMHIIGAAPKIGKGQHKGQLIQHFAFNHNRPLGVFDFELHPITTAKQIVSKQCGMDFLRPGVQYDEKILRKALNDLKDTGIMFYDRGASREWEDIRIAIEEQYLLDGAREFFIDPITALISRYTASEANDKLNEIMTDASDLVFKYPITIFFYSHVNAKPRGALPHERGGRVLSSEFTGSRALEKWSHFGFGLSRDRTSECPPEQENITDFYMLYAREVTASGGLAKLYYDEQTTRYLEV